MLLIDEPDDKAFNTQREALKKYLGIGDNNPQSTNLNEKKDVKQLSISNNEIKDLMIHEGSVHHVYNDAKRANSKYCNEHNGHPKLEEHSYSCDNDKHRNNEGRLGYPTIGVGHLIVGETELQKYCNSTITQTEIENLLTIDIIEKAEKPLKKLLNSISSSIQLTQCQYDALTSIVFNRGEGRETSKKKPDGYGFKGSDLWKDYLKNGVFNSKDPDIADKMRDALVNDGSSIAGGDRRNDEAELYFNCKYKNK